MTIEEIKERKAQLEKEIADKLNQFSKDTGISAHDIVVDCPVFHRKPPIWLFDVSIKIEV